MVQNYCACMKIQKAQKAYLLQILGGKTIPCQMPHQAHHTSIIFSQTVNMDVENRYEIHVNMFIYLRLQYPSTKHFFFTMTTN